MLLLHLHLLSIVCLEMMTFHKDASLAFNLLFTILGEKFMWTFHKGGMSPNFFEHLALPNRSTSFVPELQNRNNVLPNVTMACLFSLCIWELNNKTV
jgi:hypothetical protein